MPSKNETYEEGVAQVDTIRISRDEFSRDHAGPPANLAKKRNGQTKEGSGNPICATLLPKSPVCRPDRADYYRPPHLMKSGRSFSPHSIGNDSCIKTRNVLGDLKAGRKQQPNHIRAG